MSDMLSDTELARIARVQGVMMGGLAIIDALPEKTAGAAMAEDFIKETYAVLGSILNNDGEKTYEDLVALLEFEAGSPSVFTSALATKVLASLAGQ